jgi:hypothetical protein
MREISFRYKLQPLDVSGMAPILRWLDGLAEHGILAPSEQQRNRFGHHMYSMSTLVKHMMMSKMLKRSKPLKQAIQGALSIALGDALSQKLMDDIRDGVLKIPGQTTLYRHELSIHAGWLLHNRISVSDDDCWFAMVDSSSQGGRDWVLCVVSMLRSEQVLHAFDLASCIIQNRSRPQDGDEDIGAKMKELSGLLKLHTFTPTAVGSKRGSILHKLHALLHSWRLSLVTWYDVCRALRGCVSFTCDFGTERLLQRVPPMPLSALFPWSSSMSAGDSAQHSGSPSPLHFDGGSDHDDTEAAVDGIDGQGQELDFGDDGGGPLLCSFVVSM